jgi:undecaprenyl-diphosphatase
MNFDYQIFQLINSFAGKNVFLDALGIAAAEYLIFIMAAIVLLLIFWIKYKAIRLQIINSVAASVLAWAVNAAISVIYFRPRPFVSHEAINLINKSADSKSFPSDHTAIAFALAFSVYFFNRKLGILLLALAILVAFGRIYVGVHYPLDIVGGFIVGMGSAIFVKRLSDRVNND